MRWTARATRAAVTAPCGSTPAHCRSTSPQPLSHEERGESESPSPAGRGAWGEGPLLLRGQIVNLLELARQVLHEVGRAGRLARYALHQLFGQIRLAPAIHP